MTTFNPMILAENFFNPIQYPGHVVAGNEAATGHEAFRVGNNRRSIYDYWVPTTSNNAAYVQVTCDRVRAATCLVIDRGHNLAGKVISLTCSNDNFTTTETVFSITMPSATAPGSVDDPSGIRTEEGAWLKRFPLRSAKYWRVNVAAMGSGLKPQIVGLYLGLAYAPPIPRFPWEEESDELVGDESMSDAGWIGTGRVANRRVGSLPLFLESESDYDFARLWFHGFYRLRSPIWMTVDDAQADRAVCAVRPKNVMGWRINDTWTTTRQAQVDWIEHEGKQV
jgi:hypothetical protein